MRQHLIPISSPLIQDLCVLDENLTTAFSMTPEENESGAKLPF